MLWYVWNTGLNIKTVTRATLRQGPSEGLIPSLYALLCQVWSRIGITNTGEFGSVLKDKIISFSLTQGQLFAFQKASAFVALQL